MNILYDTVKTIVIYLILVAIVMNLIGTSSYKKYVAMFTGMLLIYIVITPIFKLFNLSNTMDYHFEENYFKVEAKDMNTQIFNADEKQKSNIFNEYKIKLENQIVEILKSKNLTLKQCDLILDEDASSQTFGMVNGINIIAKETTPNESKTKDDLIEEISIEKIQIGENKQEIKNTDNTDSVLEIEIKKELAKFYNLNINSILVEIDYKNNR